MKKRNGYIDFLKGIAIILVVFGHNIQYGSGSNYLQNEFFFDNIIFKFIYSFHMPLFAIISGYLFFLTIKKYNTKMVIIKKIRSLLVPLLTCCTLNILVISLNYYLEYKRIPPNLLENFMYLLSNSLWFLPAMFISSIIVLLIEKIKFKYKDIMYIIITIVMMILPNYLYFPLYFYMFPYFAVGYLYNKFKGPTAFNKIKNNHLVMLLIIMLFGITLSFYNYDSYIYTSSLSILNNKKQILIDLYRYIIGFLGIIVIVYISSFIYEKCKNKFIRLIEKIGKLSIGIYILSCYFNIYVFIKLASGFIPNLFIWIIETLVTLTMFYLGASLIDKVPILSKYILGKEVKK